MCDESPGWRVVWRFWRHSRRVWFFCVSRIRVGLSVRQLLRHAWCFGFCGGIRVMLLVRKRCPCAGRHLLFFAAAKKSRQKKAANTASSCVCLRDPNRSYASHGNVPARARCQRFEPMPHPLRIPVLGPAAANGLCRQGGKLCVGCRTAQVSTLTRDTSLASQSGVGRVRCESLHTVCHLGGGGLSGAAGCDAGA
jgi:hypothetical protein